MHLHYLWLCFLIFWIVRAIVAALYCVPPSTIGGSTPPHWTPWTPQNHSKFKFWNPTKKIQNCIFSRWAGIQLSELKKITYHRGGAGRPSTAKKIKDIQT